MRRTLNSLNHIQMVLNLQSLLIMLHSNAVVEYGYQIPPYPETQAYVKNVLGYVQIQERQTVPETSDETNAADPKLQESYTILKDTVENEIGSFFSCIS